MRYVPLCEQKCAYTQYPDGRGGETGPCKRRGKCIDKQRAREVARPEDRESYGPPRMGSSYGGAVVAIAWNPRTGESYRRYERLVQSLDSFEERA
jgi:hypothetical protein